MYFKFDKNKLFVYENLKKRLLCSNVGNKYIYSDNKVLYIDCDDGLKTGMLILYEDGRINKLGKVYNIADVYYTSHDLNKVIYSEIAEIISSRNREKYKYNLCYWDNGIKRILRHNVYNRLINIIESDPGEITILFMVLNNRKGERRYNLYASDINRNKEIIEKNIKKYDLFFNDDSSPKIITYNHYSKDAYGKGFLKINNGINKIEIDVKSEFDYVISRYGKLILYKGIDDKNTDLIDLYLIDTNNFKQIKLTKGLDDSDIRINHKIFEYKEALDLVFFEINIDKETVEENPEYFCNSRIDINSDNQRYLCFKKANSKRYYIAKELLKNSYDYKIINNPFELDDSENIEVIYTGEQREEFCMMHTLLYNFMKKSSLIGYQIFGIDIEELIQNCNPKFNLMLLYGDNASKLLYFKEVYRIIMDYYDIDSIIKLRSILISQFYDKYIKRMHPNHHRFLGVNHSKIKKKLKDIEQTLIMEKRLPSRWKSEANLFILIKKNYEKAIIHYYPDWLTPQHLDVYIPEINCAFEYQGQQHFREISYFGGSEGFKKRQELDKRKRKLCKLNGVKLIEWNYDEPITKIILRNKLKSIGVDIK